MKLKVILLILAVALLSASGPLKNWNFQRECRQSQIQDAREGMTLFRENPDSVDQAFLSVFSWDFVHGKIKPEEFGSTRKEVDRMLHEHLLSRCYEMIGMRRFRDVSTSAETISLCLVSQNQPVSLTELNLTMNDLIKMQKRAKWSSARISHFKKEYLRSHPDEEWWFDGSKMTKWGGLYIVIPPPTKPISDVPWAPKLEDM